MVYVDHLTVTYQVEIIHFLFQKLKKIFLVVTSCTRNLNSLTGEPEPLALEAQTES